MENFRKQYRDLEMRVHNHLRELIDGSEHVSEHTGQKAILVNVFDYHELTIVNDALTFLDENGYHFSIFADASLEDLIDISFTHLEKPTT